jgi:hypothetical protein
MTTSDESLKAVREYADDYELDLGWLDTRGEWASARSLINAA